MELPKTQTQARHPEITIAEPGHFEEILAMVAEFHQIARLPFSAAATGESLRQLLKNQNLGFVLVSKQDSMVTGYILVGFGFSLEFGGRDAFVDEIYVRPAHQGHGIGTVLLHVAEQLATERGAGAIHLESDYENPRATILYERNSYLKHPRFLMTKWLGVSSDLKTTRIV